MTKKTERVTLSEAREQVRRVCVRLALLHFSFAKTLVNELGEEKGKELILKSIKEYGTRIGEGARKAALSQGKETSPRIIRKTCRCMGCMMAWKQWKSMEKSGKELMAALWERYGMNSEKERSGDITVWLIRQNIWLLIRIGNSCIQKLCLRGIRTVSSC